jgi:DNA-binding winged helix-turn-helix (wHTH) protein/tetratricopeptide (TPR) repeat protein
MARVLYRFGDCSVDPTARELHRGGALVTLSPKVFDCLAYLIEQRERAVGRDELIAAVWGRANVTDAVLGQVVLKARRAVGDTGGGQNAIRTIPRFGYRWVAEIGVEERAESTRSVAAAAREADETPAAAAEREPVESPVASAATSLRRRARARNATIVGVALLFAVLTLVLVRRHAPPPAAPSDTSLRESGEAIAVLPVVVEGGAQWSWLRLGMMDLVAVRLQRAGLAVVPSDNIVALMRTSGSNDVANAAKLIQAATGARRWLALTAAPAAGSWRVHARLHADAGDIEVESRADDPIAAARSAAAALLGRLGRPAAGEDAAVAASSLDDILQRAEAAMLTDELDAARRIIDSAPADLRRAPELRLRLALIDLRGGRIASAREILDGLLGEVGAEANPVLRARALTVSSSVTIHSGNAAAAMHDCTEAIALLSGREEPAVLGRAYTACGVADASAGRFDAAMNDFAQARIALEIVGDALSLARIEANEGVMENTRGRYAEGVAVMRRSEERFRRFGARNEMLQAIRDQVVGHLALLQPVEALAAAERGWAQLAQIENAELRHSMQVQYARALAANGRIGEAAALLARIADEMAQAEEQALLGQVRASQADIELATGRAQAAMAHAQAAVDALASPDDARERAIAWRLLVRALAVGAKAGEAGEQMQRFSDWAATSMIAAAHAYAALADAELHWDAQRDRAAASYEGALGLAERSGVPAEISAVAIAWGDALIDAGDLEHASAVIGRVSRWAEGDFACAVAQARLYRALGREEPWRSAVQHARALAGERPIAPSALPASAGSTPPALPPR